MTVTTSCFVVASSALTSNFTSCGAGRSSPTGSLGIALVFREGVALLIVPCSSARIWLVWTTPFSNFQLIRPSRLFPFSLRDPRCYFVPFTPFVVIRVLRAKVPGPTRRPVIVPRVIFLTQLTSEQKLLSRSPLYPFHCSHCFQNCFVQRLCQFQKAP